MSERAAKNVFDEQRLRQDIAATWGEHGAHMDVFDHMLKQINVLKSKLGAITAENGSKQLRRDLAHKESVIVKQQDEIARMRAALCGEHNDGTPATGTVHIAGLDIVIDGRFIRQRCAWCGVVLLDHDAQRIALPTEDYERAVAKADGNQDALVRALVATWPVGALIEREGDGWPTVTSVFSDDDQGYPKHACMAVDPAVTL